MLGYYDKILAGIAGSLLGGVILGLATQLSFPVGVLIGALVATPFVYDAMFRNPPKPAPQGAAAAIVWHAFLFVLLIAVVVS